MFLPACAIIIGIVAGVLCFYGVRLKFVVGCDDSLDVVGVHGVGGIWGPIATGIFATYAGQGLIAGHPGQVLVQLVAVSSVGLYCLVMTHVICLVLDKVMGMRVEGDEEIMGLDNEIHGEVGYSNT